MGEKTAIPALVLDTTAYRDADFMATLLSPDRGTFAALASHARHSRTRFPSGLDRLTLVECTLAQKGSGLTMLQSAFVVEGYWGIKGDLEKGAAAAVVTEMLALSHVGPEEAGGLFLFAAEYLGALERMPAGGARPAALHGVVNVLVRLHFLSGATVCRGCDPPAAIAQGFFHRATGELTCVSHRHGQASPVALTAEELGLLREALGEPSPEAFAARVGRGQGVAGLLLKLEPYAASVFGRGLRAMEFMRGMWDGGEP